MGQSLTERVYASLKEEVLTARLAPGSSVIERELADRYEVSKTPIREALRLLVQDGWVQVVPRKGYFVRPLALEDVGEIFELRTVIEPQLTVRATRRMQLDTQTLDDFVRSQASAEEDLENVIHSARLFHLAIAEASGSERGYRILEGLLDELRRLLHLVPGLQENVRSEQELEAHRKLTQAIADGHDARAAELMREHIREAGRAMVESFGGVHTSMQSLMI